MKRTFYLAVFLVICLSLLLSGNSAARGLQGDADGNGRVNIFDALILAELSVGLRTQDQVPGYADADVDAN
ncbi:MAG: hypothetical protein GY749_49680, partial [Desulfobacteraceae bacterium]|nr:hypothetical protein [Desulfobacteraceae bacterium]